MAAEFGCTWNKKWSADGPQGWLCSPYEPAPFFNEETENGQILGLILGVNEMLYQLS